jgi:hypothetical protein
MRAQAQYIAPMLFVILTAAYFSPFYLPIVGGEASGKILAGFLVVWALCFVTFWIYAPISIVLAYRRKKINIHYWAAAGIIVITYIIWFILCANGYLLTA